MFKQILAEEEFVRQAVADVKEWTHADKCRMAKAADIAASGLVEEEQDHSKTYRVRSQSNALGSYIVDGNTHTCTCPDFPRAAWCKHRLAVLLAVKAELDKMEFETWLDSTEAEAEERAFVANHRLPFISVWNPAAAYAEMRA